MYLLGAFIAFVIVVLSALWVYARYRPDEQEKTPARQESGRPDQRRHRRIFSRPPHQPARRRFLGSKARKSRVARGDSRGSMKHGSPDDE